MSDKKMVVYDGVLGTFSYDPKEYEISKSSFAEINRVHADNGNTIIPEEYEYIKYIGSSSVPSYLDGCVDYNSIFLGRDDLITLDLYGWDVSRVRNFAFMFADCTSLELVLGLEHWDLASVNVEGMLDNCDSFKDKNILNEWKDIMLNIQLHNCIDAYNIYLFDLPDIYKVIEPKYICHKCELDLNIGDVYGIRYLIKHKPDNLDIVRYPQEGFVRELTNSYVNVKILSIDKENDLLLVKPLNNLSDFGNTDIFYLNISDINCFYNEDTIHIIDKSKMIKEFIDILKKVDSNAFIKINKNVSDQNILVNVTGVEIDERTFISFKSENDGRYVTVKEFLTLLEECFTEGHKGRLVDSEMDIYIRYNRTTFNMYIL